MKKNVVLGIAGTSLDAHIFPAGATLKAGLIPKKNNNGKGAHENH